ncbi:Tn3 family transposase [Bacillus toyonensis]
MRTNYTERAVFNFLFQLLYCGIRYISRAVDAFRAKGVDIQEEYLKHISPLGWEHITLTGDYVWNLNQKTNFNNLGPLREKNSIKKQ